MYSIKWIFISHPIYQNMVSEWGTCVCCRMSCVRILWWSTGFICCISPLFEYIFLFITLTWPQTPFIKNTVVSIWDNRNYILISVSSSWHRDLKPYHFLGNRHVLCSNETTLQGGALRWLLNEGCLPERPKCDKKLKIFSPATHSLEKERLEKELMMAHVYVWASSGSWCWIGKQFMGFQRVGNHWVTELIDWSCLCDEASIKIPKV